MLTSVSCGLGVTAPRPRARPSRASPFKARPPLLSRIWQWVMGGDGQRTLPHPHCCGIGTRLCNGRARFGVGSSWCCGPPVLPAKLLPGPAGLQGGPAASPVSTEGLRPGRGGHLAFPRDNASEFPAGRNLQPEARELARHIQERSHSSTVWRGSALLSLTLGPESRPTHHSLHSSSPGPSHFPSSDHTGHFPDVMSALLGSSLPSAPGTPASAPVPLTRALRSRPAPRSPAAPRILLAIAQSPHAGSVGNSSDKNTDMHASSEQSSAPWAG